MSIETKTPSEGFLLGLYKAMASYYELAAEQFEEATTTPKGAERTAIIAKADANKACGNDMWSAIQSEGIERPTYRTQFANL